MEQEQEFNPLDRVCHNYYGNGTVVNVVYRGNVLLAYEIAPDKLLDRTEVSRIKAVWPEDLERLVE